MLGLAAKVVHTGLQPFLPTIKVDLVKTPIVGIFDPNVEALALADKRTSVSRHIDHVFHWNFKRLG